MRASWLVLGLACACYQEQYLPCGDVICPITQACSQDHACVLPEQLAACAGMANESACTYGTARGYCHDGACSVSRCGDGIVDPDEVCDDGNNVSFDGCAADCTGRFAKLQTPTAFDLEAAWMVAPDQVYAVGLDAFLGYDGATWNALPEPLGALGKTLNAVWASSTSDVWVGGGSGLLFHYDGMQSVIFASGAPSDTITAIWGRSRDDVYAIGKATMLHFDGAAWSPVAVPAGCAATATNAYLALFGVGSTVYLGTDTALCSATSPTSWTQMAMAETISLASDGANLYALGRAIVRIYPLPIGTPLATLYPGTIQAIAMTGPDELLGVGPFGIVLRYQLSTKTWSHLASPTELGLHAVVGTSPTNVFVVGNAGTVLH